MARVPVNIQAISIIDGYMYCEKHDMRLEFHPQRKTTYPLDPTHWYRCPGLEADLEDPAKEAELKKLAQALVDDPEWGKALTPNERSLAALDQILEEQDDEDRCKWFFVVELEDATVTVG